MSQKREREYEFSDEEYDSMFGELTKIPRTDKFDIFNYSESLPSLNKNWSKDKNNVSDNLIRGGLDLSEHNLDVISFDIIENVKNLKKVYFTSRSNMYAKIQNEAIKRYHTQNKFYPKEMEYSGMNIDNEFNYLIPEDFELEIEFEKSKIFFTRERKSEDHGVFEGVDILFHLNIYANDIKIIENFILDMKKEKVSLNIYSYNNEHGYWYRSGKVQERSYETLIFDNEMKNKIKNDIDMFINSKKDYEKFGIPYKRNYMFCGKAGTGKTSLASVIANETNRSLYIMSFDSEMTDTKFFNAINDISENGILLLEDIDCVFTNRTNTNSRVTFSALLNVLDGVKIKTSLITIVTTNYANKLDYALVRPSRMDMILKFGTINIEQIKQFFKLYEMNVDDKVVKDICKYSNSKNITSSLISSFLFRNRNKNIENILEELKKYVNDINVSDSSEVNHMYL